MAQGRMLRKDICESDSFSGLEDSNSQLLLCLLTVWWTDHGKMIGEEEWIKGNVVRKLKQFTLKEIGRCLKNIHDNTDVQWWIDDKGNKWLYWPKFDNHQTISAEKKRKDIYPSPKIPKKSQENPPITLTLSRTLTLIEPKREGEGGKIERVKFLDHVFMTNNENQKLIDKLGKDLTDRYIEKLNNYIGSKGKKYQSHYSTILVWADKDRPDLKSKPSQAQVNTMASLEKFRKDNHGKEGV